MNQFGAPRLSLTKYSRDQFPRVSLTRLHATFAIFFCNGYILITSKYIAWFYKRGKCGCFVNILRGYLDVAITKICKTRM